MTLPGGLEAKEARIFSVIGILAIGVVALRVAGVSPVVVFVAASIAVAGLAWVLGVATEEAGEAAGPRLSALLNATFGNLPEMIIVILAIREGLLDVARASIIGSVIGNVLLILGAALLACGWKNGRQPFDRATARPERDDARAGDGALLAIPTLFAATTGTSLADERGLTHGARRDRDPRVRGLPVRVVPGPGANAATSRTARPAGRCRCRSWCWP